ncbi:P-loop containing nucleoside triphosphate hydrolase protein [Dendryphion nanum]|uniref:RNA helicase n=1 Tax=Dendryphion nanum TaxID=256645 RepID=A0A9P9IMA0_9PLEO|nr:P-loop containing nucleoside triphosphate hydrolase protein [Dendryphion nanum]
MPKFVPRQRKHKVLARQKDTKPTLNNDANVTEIIPIEKTKREQEKAALREELAKESKGKMSQKKKKRLEKYIETKLKKDENLALIKKLAAQKIDTSSFESSKSLGTRLDTKRIKTRERSGTASGSDHDSDSDVSEGVPKTIMNGADHSNLAPRKFDEATRTPVPVESQPVASSTSSTSQPQHQLSIQPGSGLKRPLELDDTGKPIIQIRKRQKKNKAVVPTVAEGEIAWEGFSSDEEGITDDIIASDAISDESEDDNSNSIDSEISEVETGSEASEDESDDDSETESGTSMDEDTKEAKRERSSAFKAWATQQRNEAIGFTPSNNLTSAVLSKPTNFQPRAPEMDPLPPELETNTSTDATRKAFSVAVERTQEIQDARLQLPIVAEEQKIMEAIHNHDVVVVWGATGSGKTTQVPQFLYEAGYGASDGPTPGMIGVTQPRRVAAVSMSKRVGDELAAAGSQVAYQIRFDTSTNAKTAIKFMTDGVLLREISQDFVLTKYSAIVIDEAHERSVNTDILIGMLSRIVDLRANMAKDDPKNKPLKLIIMSATLRISDFTQNKKLFRHEQPPLIKAEGRQYTVTNHFSRRTQRDFVEESFRKICRGHKKLPQGGMLVFLTGQNEIMHLAKRLRQAFESTTGQEVKAGKVQISPAEIPLEAEDIELGTKSADYQDGDGSESEGSIIMGLDDEDDAEFEIGEEPAEKKELKVHVLPLYSQLPTNQQMRVFEPPPEGSRLIVLATNVAETSLTIPGIRYVFDCGRAKEKRYDLTTGVQSFEVGWISKASANQRAGRAGRTGPGHCYRLYSSAIFERDFEEYSAPEILRTPLEGVVLQLKSMGAPVVNFPFPTPPDRESLQKAEDLLSYLGAISHDGKVTTLGKELALYPLNPRFARMLVLGVARGLAAETIALVAALSIPELIIPENKLGLRSPKDDEPDDLEAGERSRLRKAYNAAQAKLSINAKHSDCIKLFSAVCAYAYEARPADFCEDMFLNPKGMTEASQLRHQLTNIVRAHRTSAIGAYSPKLSAPSDKTLNLLTQICAAGFIDQIAMRADLAPNPPELSRKPKTAIDVPWLTLFPSQTDMKSKDISDQYVYIHPSSLLARTPIKNLPGYIVYSHLQRAAPSTITGSRAPKTRLHPLAPLTRPQIINLALGTPLLQASKPKGKIVEMPREKGREYRECEVEVELRGEKGTLGWGLGVRRVVQGRGARGEGWVVERILG